MALAPPAGEASTGTPSVCCTLIVNRSDIFSIHLRQRSLPTRLLASRRCTRMSSSASAAARALVRVSSSLTWICPLARPTTRLRPRCLSDDRRRRTKLSAARGVPETDRPRLQRLSHGPAASILRFKRMWSSRSCARCNLSAAGAKRRTCARSVSAARMAGPLPLPSYCRAQ